MWEAFLPSNLLHLTAPQGDWPPGADRLPCLGSWPDRLHRLQELLRAMPIMAGQSLGSLLAPLLPLLRPQQRRRHPPVRDSEWEQFEQEWLPQIQLLAAQRLREILGQLQSVPAGLLFPLAEAMAASQRVHDSTLLHLMIQLDPACLPPLGSLAVASLLVDFHEDLAHTIISSGQVDCRLVEQLVLTQHRLPRLLLAILQQPPSFSPHWATAHWMLSRLLSPGHALHAEFLQWSNLCTHPLKPRWIVRREVFTLAAESEISVEKRLNEIEGSKVKLAVETDNVIPVKRPSPPNLDEDGLPELHLE